MIVSGLGGLVASSRMVMRRLRVLRGLVVLVILVMMRGLAMMVRGSLVGRGRVVVVLRGRVLRRNCHFNHLRERFVRRATVHPVPLLGKAVAQ